MTKLEEAYEQAKVRQRAAQRALFIADGQKRPAEEILRLKHELDRALVERRRAFAAYMEEESEEGAGNENEREGKGLV